MKIFALGLITILLFPYEVILNGLTLSVLWEWFVVNKFDLPSLGIFSALGLMITFRFITTKNEFINKVDKEKERYSFRLASAVAIVTFKPIFILIFAYIFKLLENYFG